MDLVAGGRFRLRPRRLSLGRGLFAVLPRDFLHVVAKVLGGDGHSVQFLLMLCLAFFAFTTILGWDYYSEKCLEYLSNGNMTLVKVFRWIYIIAVAIGPYFTVTAVFTIADITNGLMAIPNCISLIVLSGVVAKCTRDYFNNENKLQ